VPNVVLNFCVGFFIPDDFYTPKYNLKTPTPSSQADSETLATLNDVSTYRLINYVMANNVCEINKISYYTSKYPGNSERCKYM
jgi:hypothetical protein